MKPYYHNGGMTIYHGDSGDLLPSLAADVIVTDPPYGFGAYKTDVDGYTEILLAAIRAAKCAAMFGYPELLVEKLRLWNLQPDEWVTWFAPNKQCGMSSLLPRSSEHIAIFGRIVGARRLTKQRAVGYSATSKAIAHQRGLSADECRLGDVWIESSPSMGFLGQQRLHPNEKPLSVMRHLVVLCSEASELIVDPYAGSGTTMLAAKELNRRAIGIEIEERYCEIAAKRLSQEVLDFPTEPCTDPVTR